MKRFFPVTVISVVLILIVFRIWQSSGCKSFISRKFEPVDVTTAVESQRRYDTNATSLEAKIFNNKFLFTPPVFLLTYSYYFEPHYLLNLVGPLGVIMFLTSILVIIEKRIKKGFLHILLVAFIIVFSSYINPKINNLLTLVSIETLSLWSVVFYAQNKKRFAFFIFLFVISLLFFFIKWQLPNICNGIFFK